MASTELRIEHMAQDTRFMLRVTFAGHVSLRRRSAPDALPAAIGFIERAALCTGRPVLCVRGRVFSTPAAPTQEGLYESRGPVGSYVDLERMQLTAALPPPGTIGVAVVATQVAIRLPVQIRRVLHDARAPIAVPVVAALLNVLRVAHGTCGLHNSVCVAATKVAAADADGLTTRRVAIRLVPILAPPDVEAIPRSANIGQVVVTAVLAVAAGAEDVLAEGHGVGTRISACRAALAVAVARRDVDAIVVTARGW